MAVSPWSHACRYCSRAAFTASRSAADSATAPRRHAGIARTMMSTHAAIGFMEEPAQLSYQQSDVVQYTLMILSSGETRPVSRSTSPPPRFTYRVSAACDGPIAPGVKRGYGSTIVDAPRL